MSPVVVDPLGYLEGFAQYDIPACRAVSSNGRSDSGCDHTDVETVNFEAEQFLRITEPWNMQQLKGKVKVRSSTRICSNGAEGLVVQLKGGRAEQRFFLLLSAGPNVTYE